MKEVLATLKKLKPVYPLILASVAAVALLENGDTKTNAAVSAVLAPQDTPASTIPIKPATPLSTAPSIQDEVENSAVEDFEEKCVIVGGAKNATALMNALHALAEAADVDDPLSAVGSCVDEGFMDKKIKKAQFMSLGNAIKSGDAKAAALVGSSIEMHCNNAVIEHDSDSVDTLTPAVNDCLSADNNDTNCKTIPTEAAAQAEAGDEIADGCEDKIAQKFFGTDFETITALHAKEMAVQLQSTHTALLTDPSHLDTSALDEYAVMIGKLSKTKDLSFVLKELALPHDEALKTQYVDNVIAALKALPAPTTTQQTLATQLETLSSLWSMLQE